MKYEQPRTDPEGDRWDRLEELLNALDGIPEGEREAYLERACSDSKLRRKALMLATAESESAGYLEGLVEGLVPDGATRPDLTERRVGAYRVLRLLGRGGMGAVYEAERADGAFEQRVALKLLTIALAGSEADDRFLAERRILASLEHPAIARIVDGGVTEDGTPWFAMEHVAGEAIDAYCDRLRLGIRERLELFLQVCDAVEHAHRKLVVHRDLKPANVLVTEEHRVKLLDFGIAKLLDTEGAAPATRTALRLMTPEYASPEQVRGEPVTTASDVYQLGLLLYELLTGHRPYSLRHCGAAELERVICDQAPTRLSAAVSREHMLEPSALDQPATGEEGGATTSVEDICRARRTSPARLLRRLRGDLENIVAKALSKEPERRYGSADRLAQDIRRHLEGLPVAARADTWIYRGRRFLERHALGASATAVALVLVLALVAGLVGFYTLRISRERDRAEAALDRAQAESAKAQQVSQFLGDLFRSADPSEAPGAELTVRDVLDRGVQRVGRELAAQPETQAAMLQVLGRTYLELGLYESAERLLTRALELRRRRLGPDHPEVAETLGDLGRLRHQQGEYQQARQQLKEASRIFEASLGSDAPELAGVLRVLGPTYRHLGHYEKGFTTLQRALSIQKRASGEDSEPVASILNAMGGQLLEMGALERAEGFYERALAIDERELGAGHPVVGGILMNLAFVNVLQGKLEGVESMYRRSLATLEKAYGPVHPMVGLVLNNLGDFLTLSGRNDEAVDVLQRALEAFQTAGGPHHLGVALSLASLGDAHLAAGRLQEARDFYQRGATVRTESLGARVFEPIPFYALVGLGRTEAALGERDAAQRSLQKALELWNQAPKTTDPRLAPSLLYLGRWLTEQQRCREALPLLRRALRIQRVRQHSAGPEIAELESLLAGCS